ncbi:hypothetical protein D3C85_1469700 [compost metagenome]
MARCGVVAEIEKDLAAHVVLIDETFGGRAGARDRVLSKVAQATGVQRTAETGAQRLVLFKVMDLNVVRQRGYRNERCGKGASGMCLGDDQFECVFSEWH